MIWYGYRSVLLGKEYQQCLRNHFVVLDQPVHKPFLLLNLYHGWWYQPIVDVRWCLHLMSGKKLLYQSRYKYFDEQRYKFQTLSLLYLQSNKWNECPLLPFLEYFLAVIFHKSVAEDRDKLAYYFRGVNDAEWKNREYAVKYPKLSCQLTHILSCREDRYELIPVSSFNNQ